MAVSISIGITQNGQSVANNTSNVTVTVTAKWTGGSHNSVISGDGKPQARGWVKIDGTQYNFESTFNTSETTSGSQTICEKTLNISHASNGSKTLSCSASFTTGVSSGTVTASASKVLTTIARKSTLSASDGTLGTSQTLTVSRYSTSYTHTITYKCGSASGTVVTKSSSTSISFTPPVSLASQSDNSLYVSVVFTITTYSGDDSLGSTTKTISCYIPDSSDTNPTVSISVSDAAGYLSTYGGYVQNKSKLSVTVTASGKQGADIKSRTTTISGKSYTAASFTTDVLPNSGSLTITTTVIDSRGRKATTERTITVLAYSPPQITSFSVYRSNASGDPVDSGEQLALKYSASVSSLSGKNTARYSFKYRVCGSTNDFTQVKIYYYLSSSKTAPTGGEWVETPPQWSSGKYYWQKFTTIFADKTTSESSPICMLDANGNAVKVLETYYSPDNFIFTFGADKSSSFDVSLLVTDNFETIEKSSTGQTATKTFSIVQKGLGWAFGKVAEVKNTLDVAWNVIARKNIYMGYYHDIEKNIFFKNNAAHTGKTYKNNNVYPHNCKVYGGNAGSPTAIGLYDSRNHKAVLVYNDHDDYIYTHSGIRQHVFQAYPSSATKITVADTWTKITLGESTMDNGLNPTTYNGSSKRMFEISKGKDANGVDISGGIKCNRAGFVMISGQLYLSNVTAGSPVGACICRNNLSTYLAWNVVKHDSSSTYVPIVPFVAPVSDGDIIYLAGCNYTDKTGTSSAASGTTRLTIQYVG